MLVTDTNIWIDLENGEILGEVFSLSYRFIVPDFSIREFQRPKWEYLKALGLQAQELEPELIRDLAQMRPLYLSLSLVDLATFVLAKHLKAILLTGDSHLRNLSVSHGIAVHGVLWLLDEMIEEKSCSSLQAALALEKMLNRGAPLPADECKQRLNAWGKSQW